MIYNKLTTIIIMAFVKRNNLDSEKVTPVKEVFEFDTFRQQALYAVKYLNEKYGEDIYDDTRKPARHINLPNNPNYVGNVGEEKSIEKSETPNTNLLNFLKTIK